MPVIYKCRNCGFVLYDSSDPEEYIGNKFFGIPTPSEIAAWYNGRCPRCGKPLNTKPDLHDIAVSIGVTKPKILKENPLRNIGIGERSESKTEDVRGNRHEKGSSAFTSEGRGRKNLSSNSDENLESNKKRA